MKKNLFFTLFYSLFSFSCFQHSSAQVSGSLDPSFYSPASFGPDNDYKIKSKLNPDGSLWAFGQFEHFSGFKSQGMVRLKPDSSVDSSFRVTGFYNSVFQTIHELPDGKIQAGGWFKLSEFGVTFSTIQLLANGSHDTTFPYESPPYFYFNYNLNHIQPSLDNAGNILVYLDFVNQPESVLRFLPNGHRDSSFVLDTSGLHKHYISNAYLLADGKIVLKTDSGIFDSRLKSSLFRYHSNGQRDQTFLPKSYSARINDFTQTNYFHQLIKGKPGHFFLQNSKEGYFDIGPGTYAGVINSVLRLNENMDIDTSFQFSTSIPEPTYQSDFYYLERLHPLSIKLHYKDKVPKAGPAFCSNLNPYSHETEFPSIVWIGHFCDSNHASLFQW